MQKHIQSEDSRTDRHTHKDTQTSDYMPSLYITLQLMTQWENIPAKIPKQKAIIGAHREHSDVCSAANPARCNPARLSGTNSSGLSRVFLWTNWNKKCAAAVPRWCSAAAAAAAAAASRWALSSLAASWAPKAPDKARRPDPLLRARLGWGSPDGCGPTGKPWACWERCWAWSCCYNEKYKETEKEETEISGWLTSASLLHRNWSRGREEEGKEGN